MNTAKQIAQKFFDEIYNKGKSTDNFYAHDFKDMCKQKATYRAEREYEGQEILASIIEEIGKIEKPTL